MTHSHALPVKSKCYMGVFDANLLTIKGIQFYQCNNSNYLHKKDEFNKHSKHCWSCVYKCINLLYWCLLLIYTIVTFTDFKKYNTTIKRNIYRNSLAEQLNICCKSHNVQHKQVTTKKILKYRFLTSINNFTCHYTTVSLVVTSWILPKWPSATRQGSNI